MKTINLCPYCERDRDDEEPRKILASIAGDWGWMFNPGGAELNKRGRRIQVAAMCNWCDLETVAKEMRANGWKIGD